MECHKNRSHGVLPGGLLWKSYRWCCMTLSGAGATGCPKVATSTNCFLGHGREQAGEPITNCFGTGQLPNSLTVNHIGVRLQASSDELFAVLVEHMSVRLWVMDRFMSVYPVNLLGAKADFITDTLPGDPLADEAGSHPVFVRLDEPIPIPARHPYYMELLFSKKHLAARMHQMFHERGPAADWVKIVGYLAGPADKPDS